MFCLRSWIPVLFFLSVSNQCRNKCCVLLISASSNASPVYLILFLCAYYMLTRPCVYCSLLLAILVIALFDFQADWFEPRHLPSAPATCANETNSSVPLQDVLAEGATLLASAINQTAGSLVEAAAGAVSKRIPGRLGWTTFGTEWIKNVASKREIRIPCVNAIIRL